MQQLELTLVVAATRSMGIGYQGTMPWTGLRKEMKYFARVTSRVLPQAPAGSFNAVIMGRKTWDSIPVKFRPLKDRLNIVISRSATTPPPPNAQLPQQDPVRVSSVEQALDYAHSHPNIARVIVMGGAQIYDAALKHPAGKRVLLTSIQREFECDVFFPLDLTGGKAEGWTRRSTEELRAWTGEGEDIEGEQEEAGTKYEFQMWEKE